MFGLFVVTRLTHIYEHFNESTYRHILLNVIFYYTQVLLDLFIVVLNIIVVSALFLK